MPGSAQGDSRPHPLSQALLAKLFQVVLFEVAVDAEEYPLGPADLVRFVFDRCQLYLADEVRYPLDPFCKEADVWARRLLLKGIRGIREGIIWDSIDISPDGIEKRERKGNAREGLLAAEQNADHHRHVRDG